MVSFMMAKRYANTPLVVWSGGEFVQVVGMGGDIGRCKSLVVEKLWVCGAV